jgi:hypothetical protein
MFCLGQPILIKFGKLVPFGTWTNSLVGFRKNLNIAQVTVAQSLDFCKNTLYGIEYISASLFKLEEKLIS